MSFNWSQYLHLARELAKEPTDEAKMRGAISRVYYGAFIKDRNYLQEREGLTIPTKSSHQYVIDQFKDSPDKVGEKIGAQFFGSEKAETLSVIDSCLFSASPK